MSQLINQVIHIHKNRSKREVQLDLFGDLEAKKSIYNFMNIDELNQNLLFGVIREFDAKLIIDVRSFPSFDRPKYDHMEVLDKLERQGIVYFPAVYILNSKINYSELIKYKEVIYKKRNSSPMLIFHSYSDIKTGKIEKFRKIINKRFSEKVELHPRAALSLASSKN